MMAFTVDIGALTSQYFPGLAAAVGTIAIVLGGVSKYKDRRQQDLIEATTTYRELAESRQAALEEERDKNKRLEKKLSEANDTISAQHDFIAKLRDMTPEVRAVQPIPRRLALPSEDQS